MDGEKILIVAADPKAVQVATVKLSNAGFWVITASDGAVALDKAHNASPDLFLIDYQLPDQTGIQLCAEIIHDPDLKAIPVVLIIDENFDEGKLKEYNIRVDGILIKPFTPKNLLSKINSVLLKSKLARELNPLTLLPGKIHLQTEVDWRLRQNREFDLIFSDLKGLQVYNKVYGYERGNEVIKFTATLMETELAKIDRNGAGLYQIEGGSFGILLDPGYAETVCENIMGRFDQQIGGFYDEADLQRGGVILKNRRGLFEQKPIMSMGLGIISNQQRKITNWLEAEEIGVELLEFAKAVHGSKFVRDRRQS
ncbi:MAG TPA: response regulator [Bacillota bacterium]|nr:response regulator [Bacillota bacterium]